MRVLVVEDDDDVRALLELRLSGAGHDVVSRSDGAAALAVPTDDVDAVVLDVGLPDVDGVELCAQLRNRGCRAPILMLTAHGELPDRVRGLDAGADDYLVKPFEPDELLARLRALQRRVEPGGPSGRLEVADLSIDTVAHRAWRSGQELPLTRRELQLLALLASRAGAPVPREELMGALYDPAADVSANALEVLVSSLRAKVDRPFGAPLVETVRGTGYRMRTG